MSCALVVDDSKPVRSILTKILGDLGFACKQAADGREALDVLACDGRPDVVTVNLHMPVMDGFTLMGRIRALPALKGLPLVAVSSEQDRSVIQKAVSCAPGHLLQSRSPPRRSARRWRPSASVQTTVLVQRSNRWCHFGSSSSTTRPRSGGRLGDALLRSRVARRRDGSRRGAGACPGCGTCPRPCSPRRRDAGHGWPGHAP